MRKDGGEKGAGTAFLNRNLGASETSGEDQIQRHTVIPAHACEMTW